MHCLMCTHSPSGALNVSLLYACLHASDGSDDDDHEVTPLIKPTSDPDLSKAMTASATTGNRSSMKWLQ